MNYLLLTTAVSLGTLLPACANLVQNGSFEAGNFVNGYGGYADRMYLANGSTDISDWTVGHDGGWSFVWWLARPSFNAIDGNYAVSLDGNDPSYNAWIEQRIPTTPGAKYRVKFAYSSDGNGGPSHTQVLVDGTVIGEVHHGSGTGGPEPAYNYLDWDKASFDFTATGASTMLRFFDATLGNYNTILDDVSVSCVPEATPTLLATLGATACIAVAVRGAKQRRTA